MRLFLTVFVLLIVHNLSAQNWEQKIDSLLKLQERPKIGLALSGGGAHGLAHIGVIKYLEERKIPIDYITGTSIGAIVGGMYALGYSHKDMEDVVSKYNWDAIVANAVPLQEVDPMEKQFHDKIPITLKIEENKLVLPEAFYEGYKLDLKVQEIFSAAFLSNDFSKLPRQFKCYSVDLLSGNIVEHSSGSLAEAIRASMAIPSVFTPVRKDSMLLVDGGLMKNFPAQEVKDMGADFVIGVYVGSKRGKLEDINSMTDILKLTGFLTSLNDTKIQKQKCDILIEPDVKDYPILDFSYFNIFQELGYTAALKNGEKFDELSNLLGLYNNKEAEIIPIRLPKEMFLEDLIISPLDGNYSDLLTNEFFPLIKTNVSIEEFNDAINAALSTKDIKNVKAGLQEGGLGQILRVDYSVNREREIGISLNHFDNTNSSIILSGTLRNIFLQKTTARGFVRVGDNSAISGLIYRRIGDRNKTLLTGSFYISKFNDPIFRRNLGKKELNHYDLKIGAGIKYIIGAHKAIDVGYAFYNRSLQPKELRELDVRDFDQNLQKLEFKYEENTLDNWAYPNHGNWSFIATNVLHNIQQEVSYTSSEAENIYGVPENNSNFSIQMADRRFYSLSEKLVSETSASYGFYSDYSLVDYFRIGGSETYSNYDLPFIGSDQGEYRLKHYLYLMQGLRYKVAHNFFIKMSANYLRGKSYNRTYMNRSIVPEWESVFGFGVTFGFKSLIGPINLNLGYKNDSEDYNLGVGVGYRYQL